MVGGVDIDVKKRYLFQLHYKKKAFENILEALTETNPDLVVISTPTDQIFNIVQIVLSFDNVKSILCEKPMSSDYVIAKKIINACLKKKCKLFVNYMRSSDIGVNKVKKYLNKKSIIMPLKGNIWYSKGLYNSASHFVHSLQYLFGDVVEVNIIKPNSLNDLKELEPDFQLVFKNADFIFLSLNYKNIFYNSMEFMTQNCRLRYERGGAEIYLNFKKQDVISKNYNTLSEASINIKTDFYKIQRYVVNEIFKSLNSKEVNLSYGDDALETLRILKIIKDKI